jgi:release factor glutamine methyltransferase
LKPAAGCGAAGAAWPASVREAAIYGLGRRVFVRRGDMLEPVPKPLDLVVANLPYLPEAVAADYPDLLREPARAVFAPGDGLGPYRRLIEAAANWLVTDGVLLLQLDGSVFAGRRDELPTLRESVDASRSAAFVAYAA